jgi:hypothetical protein
VERQDFSRTAQLRPTLEAILFRRWVFGTADGVLLGGLSAPVSRHFSVRLFWGENQIRVVIPDNGCPFCHGMAL